MAGSSWQLDVAGVDRVLSAVDVAGADLCSEVAMVTGSCAEVSAVLPSGPASVAMSGFIEVAEDVAAGMVSRVGRATGGLTGAVVALVCADEQMGVTTSQAAAASVPSAERFAGRGGLVVG